MGLNFKNKFAMIAMVCYYLSPDINNIAIINIKDVDYCCIVYSISKSDAIFCNKIYI